MLRIEKVIGLILGAYTGFYGAGGGAFILLAFTTLTKLDLITASGNTKDSDGK